MSGQGTNAKSVPAREVPTYRMIASEQMAIASTIGILPQPFSVHDVEAKLGVPSGRVGLTMGFFEYCGLVMDAPGRGMYVATAAATRVADAWAKDAELGKAALRRAWNQTWFTKSARTRLSQGAGLRSGIHARFLALVGGGSEHRRSVDKLMELMVLAGLLIEEPDGFVRWYEESAHQSSDQQSHTGHQEQRKEARSGDSRRVRAEDVPDAERNDDAEDSQAASADWSFPGPRVPDDDKVPTYGDSPEALLSDPLRLAYVRHMTPSEAAELYKHLHGVLGILTQVRDRAKEGDGAPSVELEQPLHLSDLGAVDLKTWLAVYASGREMAMAVPSMRSRRTTSH